jgi:hypothetical protein
VIERQIGRIKIESDLTDVIAEPRGEDALTVDDFTLDLVTMKERSLEAVAIGVACLSVREHMLREPTTESTLMEIENAVRMAMLEFAIPRLT